MNYQERLDRHLGKTPDVARALFVAPNATVHGDVVLGPWSSVFYGAVLRGDIHEIRVGEGTNIQDNAIVHLADEYGAYIGAVHHRPRRHRPCLHDRGRMPDRHGGDGPRWSPYRRAQYRGRQFPRAAALHLPAGIHGLRIASQGRPPAERRGAGRAAAVGRKICRGREGARGAPGYFSKVRKV